MKDLRKTAEELATKYADEQNSAYTNDFYGFKAGFNAAIDLVLPKPIPFNANDPSTFPKEQDEYLVKVNGFWLVDRWSDMTFWFNYKDEEVTHYAEILMPE